MKTSEEYAEKAEAALDNGMNSRNMNDDARARAYARAQAWATLALTAATKEAAAPQTTVVNYRPEPPR